MNEPKFPRDIPDDSHVDEYSLNEGYCPRCGYGITDFFKPNKIVVCGECGQKMEGIFCDQCQTLLKVIMV